MAPPYTPPFTRLSSFNDLCDMLDENGLVFTADDATLTVEIPTRRGPLSASLFVRWDTAQPLVQIIQPVIADIPEDREVAVADALARVNHSLPLPGFALDHAQGFVYFRVTLPRDEHDKVSVPTVHNAMIAAADTARDYCEALHDVAFGALPPADVLARAAGAERPGLPQ